MLTSPSIFADVGTKITVMENILHAFSLDRTEPHRSTLEGFLIIEFQPGRLFITTTTFPAHFVSVRAENNDLLAFALKNGVRNSSVLLLFTVTRFTL